MQFFDMNIEKKVLDDQKIMLGKLYYSKWISWNSPRAWNTFLGTIFIESWLSPIICLGF
jgi:hypothetical protein